jgi:hypothetical protein
MVRTVYNTIHTVSNSICLRIYVSKNVAKFKFNLVKNITNPYSLVPLATFRAYKLFVGGGGEGCPVYFLALKNKMFKIGLQLIQKKKKVFFP